jgi:hypothetical protein
LYSVYFLNMFVDGRIYYFSHWHEFILQISKFSYLFTLM